MSVTAFLVLVSRAATKYLSSRSWKSAFESVGARGLDTLSSEICEMMTQPYPPTLPEGPPAPDQLRAIFPCNLRPCPIEFLSLPRRRLRQKTSVIYEGLRLHCVGPGVSVSVTPLF